MLGSHILFSLGIVLLLALLQAGATSAVKAIKISAKLATGKASRPDGGTSRSHHPGEEVASANVNNAE
jgi:hypothetical protein